MKIIDVLTSPWAIEPNKLKEITGIYSSHLKGDKINISAIEAAAGEPFANKYNGYDIIDGVAVIPVDGIIAKKMNLFMQISGGVSTNLLLQDFNDAMNNEDVHSIIFDIDSPGGTVDGTEDIANAMFAAREHKPIVALANGLMASAAYWIGSAASKVYISNKTTNVGSIGVIATHVDYSEQLKERGIKVTEIYAGKYKRISSEYKPLSDEGAESMQEHVDYIYSIFVDTVAKNRGVDYKTVINNMADGRIFIGEQSISAGLVDGVSTLSALIDQLNSDNSFVDSETTAQAMNSMSDPDLVNKIQSVLKSGETVKIGSNTNKPKDTVMNITLLKEKHPDIAAALFEEGRKSVDVDAIKKESASNAAKAECDRIKGIESQLLPGYESVINTMKYDGKSTAADAALKIVAAEKKTGANALKDIQDGAPDPVAAAESTSNIVKINVSEDDQIKSEWSKSSDIQSEFLSFDDYSAFRKQELKKLKKA